MIKHTYMYIYFFYKVHAMQKSSEIYFYFFCIWFDRAWAADHDELLFIVFWSYFVVKNRKTLEKPEFFQKSGFWAKHAKITMFLFLKLKKNFFPRFSIKNWFEKTSEIGINPKIFIMVVFLISSTTVLLGGSCKPI